jgi:hypothetical protein
MDCLAGKVDEPVVNETSGPPPTLSWRDHPFPRSRDALLRNVAAQTGLRFDREAENWDVWWTV